ncbi:MAG TPA: helix-turn-helix domain-containing protein [Streptosporangiaceae bacterium]|nr:helix-turn-helix domain-containing protein [Streptosporangiaceae bacterium]
MAGQDQAVVCAAPNLLLAGCPSRQALDLIADKWSVLVLYAVNSGLNRHGQMLREIEGISHKMLTQSLHELQRSGLIRRQDYQQRPLRVEYSLTASGTSLLEVVQRLCDWSVTWMPHVSQARATHSQ